MGQVMPIVSQKGCDLVSESGKRNIRKNKTKISESMVCPTFGEPGCNQKRRILPDGQAE